MKGYKLGRKSLDNLKGVHPDIVAIIKLAIRLSDVDFSVVEGIRSEEKQAENIENGVSWTMDSAHICGWAVDIYPWVDGATSHETVHYYRIAKAIFAAAAIMGKPISWGGFWWYKGCSRPDMPHWEGLDWQEDRHWLKACA